LRRQFKHNCLKEMTAFQTREQKKGTISKGSIKTQKKNLVH